MKNVFLPERLDELWPKINKDTMIYSGGTDLLVWLRNGLYETDNLICLEKIDALKGIEDRGDSIWIGPTTTISCLLKSDIIKKEFPLLIKSINELGSPLIRNMATIGGNICTASPAGDTLPALYILEAQLELRTEKSLRNIPIKDFISGPGKTDLKQGEILSGIIIKKPSEFNIHHFEKVGQRKSLAISIASFSAMLKVSENGIIEKARLAWGSVGPTIVMSDEINMLLTGRKLTIETLEKASKHAEKIVKPIDDIRATGDYRRKVSGNLIKRLYIYG